MTRTSPKHVVHPTADASILCAVADGTSLAVHVQPKASRSEYVGRHGDAIKIRVAAPPADGAANDELRRYLAEYCEVPMSAVRITAGTSSRRKRVVIAGRAPEALRMRFGLDKEKD